MPTTSEIKPMSVRTLHFDWKNPRLAEYGISKETKDDEILSVLWKTMDVRELVQSIAASGYFSHEPLIVAREDGKNIVIEGNRRLAAVKVLLNPEVDKDNGWEIPTITPTARKLLEELPAILSNRQESWRYLGFKHVNGPAKWSSYAKANYIAEVHRAYSISLSDIANQIGDRHRTVQRLYRGLMVMEQAEREKVYHRDDRFRQRFAFSHLYTGLDYDGISEFVSLKSEDDETTTYVPKGKIRELGELCVWLYGSKRDNRPPVVETQNPDLRRLSAVLTNREAVAALRAGTELVKAFEISRPPTAVFEEALLGAKRELTTARAHLTTGYDKSEALLRIAGSVANLADDLYTEMERKQNPDSKKRRLSEG
ncbi:MAG: hypothetical protein LV473_14765 [Nitrospira sp.]|nr:hypothetical protein [Nitrospira sp.]